MYLMYVDESGDPGVDRYASPHYILSGLIVSQGEWAVYLDRLKTFRKYLKERYKLNQRIEVHAAELIRINKIQEYRAIRKSDRIRILKDYAAQVSVIFDTARIINICFDKKTCGSTTNVQETVWSRLIQRYDTFLKKTTKDSGIIISDDVTDTKVMNVLRRMRVYNPVASHYTPEPYNAPTVRIIEDIFHRSSHHSYFIQTVDVIAHLLYRREYPKGSLKKYGLERDFAKIEPILLKEASKSDPLGIVRK